MLDNSSQDNTGPSQNAACDKARPTIKEAKCLYICTFLMHIKRKMFTQLFMY